MPSASRSPRPADQGRFLVAFEVDVHGNVSRWTHGAEQVLGWSSGEVIGRPPPVPPPWEGVKRWNNIGPGPAALLDATCVWRGSSGARYELSVCTSPAISAEGEVLGVSVAARDISARTQLHEQLQAYARDVRESYGRELHRLADLQASYRATVEALASAVEAKDDTTGGHIRRVCQLGLLLANAHLGTEADDPQLAYGFLLHDIGKLAVPDAVLNKPGQLDADEWALIQRHPEEGARILAGVPFLDRALDVVRFHHERWDGTGYPNQLAGEGIPVWARIFSIVDTVDAMTSDRPYRARLSLDEAIAEVQAKSGTQFDPACVATFVALKTDEVQAMLEAGAPE
ncbi:MAG: HD domain-containing protein [Solirubrobacteraceae bacterium]|nr:HD domain-containing protein [Solirubrobacteraceae bacterium]